MVEVIQKRIDENEKLRRSIFGDEFEWEYGNPFFNFTSTGEAEFEESFGRRRLQQADDGGKVDSTKFPEQTPSSPAAGGFPEKMCEDATDGKCEIKDESFILHEDTVLRFEKLESLILDNVNVTCISKKGTYCTLEIILIFKDRKDA